MGARHSALRVRPMYSFDEPQNVYRPKANSRTLRAWVSLHPMSRSPDFSLVHLLRKWALSIRHSAFGQCAVSMNHKTFTGRKPTAESRQPRFHFTRSPDFSLVHHQSESLLPTPVGLCVLARMS